MERSLKSLVGPSYTLARFNVVKMGLINSQINKVKTAD